MKINNSQKERKKIPIDKQKLHNMHVKLIVVNFYTDSKKMKTIQMDERGTLYTVDNLWIYKMKKQLRGNFCIK